MVADRQGVGGTEFDFQIVARIEDAVIDCTKFYKQPKNLQEDSKRFTRIGTLLDFF